MRFFREEPALAGSAGALVVLGGVQLALTPVPWPVWAVWAALTVAAVVMSVRSRGA